MKKKPDFPPPGTDNGVQDAYSMAARSAGFLFQFKMVDKDSHSTDSSVLDEEFLKKLILILMSSL